MNPGRTRRDLRNNVGAGLWFAVGGVALALSGAPAASQPVNCRDLSARIAALGDGGQKFSNHYGSGSGVQKQRAELDRTIRYARSLGCDRNPFAFFGASAPQCPSLNAQIQQMQANVARSQPSGDGERQQLTAAYNAYCRGHAASNGQPAEQRGFFESLLGALNLNLNPSPFGQPGPFGPRPPGEQVLPEPGEDRSPHGGSQALCVRSCDGGFFPLSVPARQSSPDELTNLCQALCPNAEVSVYTRSPYLDITSAVSLDGETPYSEAPNALKFRKTFDPACTCKPPGQSWAEALAGAEQILGRVRKSDILVTPETSDELSKPRFDKAPPPQSVRPLPVPGGVANGYSTSGKAQGQEEEVTGPDGVKRRVRIIVPPL